MALEALQPPSGADVSSSSASAARQGGVLPAEAAAVDTMPPAAAPNATRTARCACGSGLRYKHCCGRLATPDAMSAQAWQPDYEMSLLFAARLSMQIGAGAKAATVLARMRAPALRDAAVAREAGEMCLDLHDLERSVAFLRRALELDANDAYAARLLQEVQRLLDQPHAWRECGEQVGAQIARIEARARPSAAIGHVHIVSKLDTIGGTETRALCLWRLLRRHVPVTLWSTEAPHASYADYPIRRLDAAHAPEGGAVAIVGTYFECGDWLERHAFQRVVICHNLAEQHLTLARRLDQVEANASRPSVRLVFPSHFFRALTGLPGLVQYSEIDLEALRRRRTSQAGRSLVIGRHGRAFTLKFHPNDAELFRALADAGHQVRILGGAPMAPFFADQAQGAPILLEVGSEPAPAFLDGLDVFLYRKHPQIVETLGTVILEAMAASLPVVVFPDRCGAAELIVDGENGFLVDDEPAALAVIERLRDDPALRERVGAAARATIERLMREQELTAVAHYLN